MLIRDTNSNNFESNVLFKGKHYISSLIFKQIKVVTKTQEWDKAKKIRCILENAVVVWN